MTRFLDGPAAGVMLSLRRAPIMLRVVRSCMGNWDALDQPEDVAQPREEIFVYRLTAPPSRYHLCIRGKGKKDAGFYHSGNYAHLADAPDGEQFRDNDAWAKWCEDNWESLVPEWAREGAGHV